MDKIRGFFVLKRDLTYLNNWNNNKKRKPLILRGARQVGKSTIVRLFAKEAGLKLAEINLERHPLLDKVFSSLNVQEIVSALETVCNQHFEDHKTILFLDEIQATPHAIAALRYFYEDRPQLHVIAAGSLLEFVLSDHQFSMPVGRVEYHWIRPMSFVEVLGALGEDILLERWNQFQLDSDQAWPEILHEKFWKQYRLYVALGGMPEVVSVYVNGARENQIKNIFDNIIASYGDDFAKYARKTELVRLHHIYRQLPKNIGKKLKFSEVMSDTKTNLIKHSVELLTMAGIIHRVFHSDCSGIPIRAGIDPKIFKIYWLDIGLLNRMNNLSWNAIQSNQSILTEGFLAEQFVTQELLARQKSSDPIPLTYWLREGKANNAEVDFVIQKEMKLVPLEVKSGSVGTLKSIGQFIAKTSQSHAFRLCSSPPSSREMKMEIPIGSTKAQVKCHLTSLPLYLAGKLI
jgi:predicted AAA+ superfamily ATPase